MLPSASNRRQDSGLDVLRLLKGTNPYVMDAVLAMVLTVAALATVLSRTGGAGDFRGDDLLGGGLVFLQTAPLAARRLMPIGVFLVINVALIAYSAVGYEVVQVGTFSSLVAVYGAAAFTDTRRGLFAGAFSIAAIAVFFGTNRGEWDVLDIATISGTWAIAWMAGIFVRMRGEQVEAAGARASRLEFERDTFAREAVADERARMARELHDIVGHALNVIVIQAGGARHVFDTKPEVSREVLESIEATGREALVEMERMLEVLRASDVADEVSGSLSGLAQVDGLAAHVSEAGLPVKVIVEGDRPEVPASVDLSAYRIVQESLTNCLKHSGASRATVTIRYRSAGLEIEIDDNGHGRSAEGQHGVGGRGQLGMRERVAMFGGEIDMGPSEGGYRVRARLPYEGRTTR